MGYFDADVKDMLDIYILETKQFTAQLSEVLLAAEKKNFFSEEDIHTIFRIMHTIKSSSAMMGLQEQSAMAHKLEDLFGYYRETFGKISKPEPELFDLLFQAADYIEDELKHMVREDYAPADAEGIDGRIHEYLARLQRGMRDSSDAPPDLQMQTEEGELAGKAVRDFMHVDTTMGAGAGADEEVQEAEFLNIRTDRLDKLQNMAGEMMIQLQSLEMELSDKGLDDIREGSVHHISRLIAEVERAVMEMRMVPVVRIIPRLKRILRDICRDQNKEVDLIVQGTDIEADKNVIEYISEAAIHLIRNALDHGIESAEEREKMGKDRKGTILFNVESTVGELLISISDDGSGLNEAKIRDKARKEGLFTRAEEEYSFEEICEMILMPGFTTNDKVTEYSGRGVGLDVVRSVLENAGGYIYIQSEQGKGSTFTITAPLTLATMECIRFQVAEYRFSLPARYVFQFMEYQENIENIRIVNDREFILYEGRLVPFINLRKFYSFGGEVPEGALIVYVRGTKKEGCIIVERMHNQKRIVIKPLPALFGMNFRRNTGMSGCSIMGSGDIYVALDTEILIDNYEKEERHGRK